MKSIKLIVLVLAWLMPTFLMATVTASKPTVKIVRNTPASFYERYHISDDGSIDICTQATSTSGTFSTISGTQLGTVFKTITTPLSGTSVRVGNASESIRVPYSVMKKAEQMGLNTFLYNRNFTFFGGSSCMYVNGNLSITIKTTTSAAVPLHINKIQLYFKNRRADIAVDKDQKLSLNVDLQYYGKGLLKGYWEIDGRILSRVYKQISYGNNITLTTPKVPGLPTFEVGTHRVRFVITSPEPTISLPQALYFVKESPALASTPIKLFTPKDGAVLKEDVCEFKWQPKSQINTYLIEFYKKGNGKPLFSALSQSATYTVPSYVLKKMFQPDTVYEWKVSGFNALSNIAGESQRRSFMIK